jgi:hypothetical protein
MHSQLTITDPKAVAAFSKARSRASPERVQRKRVLAAPRQSTTGEQVVM